MHIPLSDHFTYGKLIKFTIPSVAMMIFTSIYSVIDGFFVSNYAGKTPFAAINLIMPVLIILGTAGFMLGTGGTALVARTYGEGRKALAQEYFSLFVYVAFGIGVLLALLGLLWIRPIAEALGATGQLLEHSLLYARVNLVVLPFYILQVLFQSFFVAAEKPHLGLAVTVSFGLTNIILDAVLVPLLPQPQKLLGAAIATAISQTIGGVVPLFYFFLPNSSILRLGKTRFYRKALTRACINGASEFMSNISMSLVGILYNWQLMKYSGENGLAAYGVMMYVSMIFSAVFIGFSMGGAPIISFHYGAQNHYELKSLLKKSLILTSLFSLGMVISAQVLAAPLSYFFVGYDPDLYQMTVSGFRIFALSFGFMGFAIFTSSFFTALNDGMTSALISFLRTLVFQCAAILLLPLLWQIHGIWASVVVAEAMAVAIGCFFLVKKRKQYQY